VTALNFNLPDIPNPLDYFVEFVDNNLWDFIVIKTNLYADQKLSNSPECLANFVPVTRAEMKAFIGINIIIGLPQSALYWPADDHFRNLGIKKVMTGNRFQEINCYFHFSDSSVEPAQGTPGFNHLYKIRRIFDYVLVNCQTMFKPTKNLSVGEAMIGVRGRLYLRQYMPAKATKYGIKVWMVADSSSGYVLNFDVYLGKEVDGCWRIHGLGYDVVTKFIRPYTNRSHHVFFDIFSMSTKLLEHLETNGTYACRTYHHA